MAVLLPLAAWADPPNFSKGGFLVQLQYGPGWWTMDGAKLDTLSGTPAGSLFASDLPLDPTEGPSHAASLSLAYNILGHASIGADITGTGWNIDNPSRGGAGFVIGKVAWHPLELVFLNKDKRPIALDFSTFFGVGYGIAGGGRNPNPLGMDGLLFEWGLNVDYFFARFFGVGFFARGVFFNWEKLYVDYNNNQFFPLSAPSGGSFWTLGLSLTFRAGD